MKAERDESWSDLEDIPTDMMMNGSKNDVEEITHLRSSLRELTDQIKILQDGMDAMVSDIAISEALAEANHKGKEQAEQKCFELAQKVDDLSRMLRDQNQHQAEKESRPAERGNILTKGVQVGMPSGSIQADIEASLESQFQQREAEIMEQCKKAEAAAQECRQKADSAQILLVQAETRINTLEGENQRQLADLNTMAAKEDQLKIQSSIDSSQTAKIEQLQSLVEFYKANNERLSREFKKLKKQSKAHLRAPMSLPQSTLSYSGITM